jgi:hypothetical protein
MVLVRTTMQPEQVLEVDEAERWWLGHLGALHNDPRTLYVNFLAWEGGPVDDTVYGVTATLKNDANVTVATGTAANVQRVREGVWVWQIPTSVSLPAGTYTVTWLATGGDGDAIVEADTVEVS